MTFHVRLNFFSYFNVLRVLCFNNLNNNLFSSKSHCAVLILTWTAGSYCLRRWIQWRRHVPLWLWAFKTTEGWEFFYCDPFQTAIFIFAYKYRATKNWDWLKWPDNYTFPRWGNNYSFPFSFLARLLSITQGNLRPVIQYTIQGILF